MGVATVGLADEVEDTLRAARREAEKEGINSATNLHLLVALTKQDGLASGILVSLGVDEAKLREAMRFILT